MSRFDLGFRGGLKMRAKLILAFLGLSLLIAICGASGLFFVQRIGASVTVFADVTSPMLGYALQLVDNAQRMRAVLVDAANGDKSSNRLAELEAAARRDIDSLRQLSDRAGLTTQTADMDRRLQEFVRLLRERIAASSREKAATARSQGLIEQFNAQRRDFDALLTAVGGEAETKMVEAEDRAKIEVQTGAATVEGLGNLISETLTETYPLLQGVNKLIHDVVKLEEATTSYIGTDIPDDLGAIAKRVQAIFKTSTAATKRIGGRMRSADGKKRVAEIAQGLDKLEKLLLGDGGVFAVYRESLTARIEALDLQQASSAAEAGYLATRQLLPGRQCRRDERFAGAGAAAQATRRQPGHCRTPSAGVALRPVARLAKAGRITPAPPPSPAPPSCGRWDRAASCAAGSPSA
jgi:hypothetical protein